MKYLVKFFVVTLLFFVCTHTSAEEKIAFLDLKFVLNNSKAGEGAQNYLQKMFKDSQDKFSKTENELKKEEQDLLAKRKIMKQEDYKKKVDELRKKVITHQSQRRKVLEKISKQRADAKKQLLSELDPILKSYIEENGITIVLNKDNVVMGKNELNITEVIVKKLNKEFPSLKLN